MTRVACARAAHNKGDKNACDRRYLFTIHQHDDVGDGETLGLKRLDALEDGETARKKKKVRDKAKG
jgi:hypothetical protein